MKRLWLLSTVIAGLIVGAVPVMAGAGSPPSEPPGSVPPATADDHSLPTTGVAAEALSSVPPSVATPLAVTAEQPRSEPSESVSAVTATAEAAAPTTTVTIGLSNYPSDAAATSDVTLPPPPSWEAPYPVCGDLGPSIFVPADTSDVYYVATPQDSKVEVFWTYNDALLQTWVFTEDDFEGVCPPETTTTTLTPTTTVVTTTTVPPVLSFSWPDCTTITNTGDVPFYIRTIQDGNPHLVHPGTSFNFSDYYDFVVLVDQELNPILSNYPQDCSFNSACVARTG